MGSAQGSPGSSTPLQQEVDIHLPHSDAQRDDIDVVDELTTDHRNALELLERIGTIREPAQRRELADTVIAEVVRHSVAEEMYVYPAMREHVPDGEQAAEHDTREHKELERTMKELESVDATDARFETLVRDMTEKLRHHAHDEETEQFPRLRERLPRDTLISLREKVDTAKKIAPTRPHPTASCSTSSSARAWEWWTGCGTGSAAGRTAERTTSRRAGRVALSRAGTVGAATQNIGVTCSPMPSSARP